MAIILGMDTDFTGWLASQQGRQYELHRDHINPAFVKMLKAIGFDKGYVRGEGCYLWDGEGNKYLDLLTGWGVFALGRNHPKVRAILQQLLAAELNYSAFGSTPAGGFATIQSWEDAYCGTNQNAIKDAATAAGAFNEAGDSGTFTPGTSADVKTGKKLANIPTWDVLP